MMRRSTAPIRVMRLSDLGRLLDLRAVLGHPHGAKLVDGDLAAIQAVAALLEDDGTGRGDLDQHGDEHQQRQQQQQDQSRTSRYR